MKTTILSPIKRKSINHDEVQNSTQSPRPNSSRNVPKDMSFLTSRKKQTLKRGWGYDLKRKVNDIIK